MLDFYLISDDSLDREEPSGLVHVGGLTLEEHKAIELALDLGKERGLEILFFEDQRFFLRDVDSLLDLYIECSEKVEKSKGRTNSYDKVISILSAAKKSEMGLATFCD